MTDDHLNPVSQKLLELFLAHAKKVREFEKLSSNDQNLKPRAISIGELGHLIGRQSWQKDRALSFKQEEQAAPLAKVLHLGADKNRRG